MDGDGREDEHTETNPISIDMYSTKENIRQLTSLMVAHGVTEVVISPGSRNMPLAETFAHCEKLHCHAVTDERSAGFYALGLAQQKESPVAVCVTSGSALLNLASAVSEAYYQQLPLLVISADRPEAWIGQMDGQTIPQMGSFGRLVKSSVCLNEPSNDTDRWHNNRMINEALLALQLHHPGPVHINVPITEPFFDCSATELPQERTIQCVTGNETALLETWRAAHAPMIIVGQLSPKSAKEIEPLLERIGVPILCESLSNLHTSTAIHLFDLTLVAKKDLSHLVPDLVIYLGGHIVSKRLKRWLRNQPPKNLWRISPEGAVQDTFQALTHVIKATPLHFLTLLESHICDGHRMYFDIWQSEEDSVRQKLCCPKAYAALSVAYKFCEEIPQGSTLVLANSSSVRYAQLAPSQPHVNIYCNRGVNGIDGSLSSAVGIAAADTSRPVYLLIGDLSFFYDMNGLWNTHLPHNLHILLINNGGGEIFRTLPGLPDNPSTRTFVMASHGATAKGWVESMQCRYVSVKNAEEYQQNLSQFIQYQGKRPIVMEVFTDPIQDEEVQKSLYRQFE